MKKSLFLLLFVFVSLSNVGYVFSMNTDNSLEKSKELNIFTAQFNSNSKGYIFKPNDIISKNEKRLTTFLESIFASTVDMPSRLLKGTFQLDEDVQMRNRLVDIADNRTDNCSRSNFLLVSKDGKNDYNYIGQFSCITLEELLSNINPEQFMRSEGFIVKQPYDSCYSNKEIKKYNYLPLSKFLWRYRFMFSMFTIAGILAAFSYQRCVQSQILCA